MQLVHLHAFNVILYTSLFAKIVDNRMRVRAQIHCTL